MNANTANLAARRLSQLWRDELSFQRREEALGDRIVPTHAGFAGTLAHLVCGEQVTVG
jgi:hypothetical protein